MTSVVHTFLIAMKGARVTMSEYKDLYFKLFNRITDIIEELKELQAEAEDMYLSCERDENNITSKN